MSSPDPDYTALFLFGTRPEAIKMAPVIRAFQSDGRFRTQVCTTGQHRTMLDQVLGFFGISPDLDLGIMTENQQLSGLAAKALTGCAAAFERMRPDIVLVQGDTTTAFAGAFAAYLQKIPVAHIEAGLRSGQKYSPFPEEMNRVLVSDIADLHFAPVEAARGNLSREGITENVFVVGNTVIDALLLGLQTIAESGRERPPEPLEQLDFKRPIVLVTIHRRESFGAGIERICEALLRVATMHSDAQFVYPVHLNPNVREPVFRMLGQHPQMKLVEPLLYPDLIWAMSKADLIITDSGGIQEEAPSLGVPVLVARETTERPEGVAAGCAQIVGTDTDRIVAAANAVLKNRLRVPAGSNPYGDGKSSQRVVDATADFLRRRTKA